MGERIAVVLVRPSGRYGLPWEYPKEKSVVMYSQWGGDEHGLRNAVQRWLKELPQPPKNGGGPIDRREPDALIPAFLQSRAGSMVDRIFPAYGKVPFLDWGFWEIDTITGKAKKVQ